MGKRIILCFLIILTISFSGYTEEPPWVTFEKAKWEFQAGEYGRSVELLKKLLIKEATFPEAELLLGDIYLKELEFEVAIRYYNRAIERKAFFYTPEDKFACFYKLADLYWKLKEYQKREDLLLAVIDEDEDYRSGVFDKFKDKMTGLYINNGFDRMMVLYRNYDNHAVSAHNGLAWLMYKTCRHRRALDHSLFSVNIILSIAVREYIELNPEFEYTTLEDFLERAREYSFIWNYMTVEEEFFRHLYYLGAVSFALKSDGKSGLSKKQADRLEKQAAYLWKAVSGFKEAGAYGDLAKEMLLSPCIEEPLEIKKVEPSIEEQAKIKRPSTDANGVIDLLQ